ncbi:hypothetical protein MHU86_25873 [Fragilaria crotonensis]|nr:hypothetical protein MHU86_25873 [Fragilaria crotonensis]
MASFPHPSFQHDDDDDRWEPLEQEEYSLGAPVVSAPFHRRSSPSAASSRRTTTHAKDGALDLRMLQRKLETNSKLKEGLVDHPLDQAWQRFLTHLGRELWELDFCARLGAVLIVLGTIFQGIVMATFVLDVDPQALLSMVSLRRMSTAHVRHALLGSLLIPTWLETRTLGYLSQVLCNAGWGYNLFVTAVVAGVVAYRRKYQPQLSIRHLFYTAFYILYGGAFWVSLLHFRIRDIPSTAGPFLLSSGTLLLAESDRQQYTRALRHTLRLTLRDALAVVSDNVHKDEMLQLAMMRWIVEYWSTRPVSPNTAPPPSAAGAGTISLMANNPVQVQVTPDRPDSRLQRRPTARPSSDAGEIQWNDLLPMLDLTTEQMEEEVRRSSDNDYNYSFESLRQMLASMDVDEHALPAVNAYKRAVEDFPPDRTTSLLISVLRRCPACLLIIWRCLAASPYALPSILTLLPFVILEAYRVLYWADACHRQVADGQQEPNDPISFETITSIPIEFDSMSLLLSQDTFSLRGPPTLLQVWFNVQASVRALETGLSAARCAQTTVVAADFANNIMSLAELGCEVSQNGWIHGLSILAQELVHLQVTSREGRYTSAVRGALKNSQKIVHHFQVLAVEDAPIIAFLRTIVGRGWLWGHEEPPLPESTVVITELAEGEEADTDEAQDGGSASAAEQQLSQPDARKTLKFDKRGRELDTSCFVENLVFMEGVTEEPSPCPLKSLASCLNNEEQHEVEDAIDEEKVGDLLKVVKSVHEHRLISDVVKISFEAMLSGEPTKAVVENVKISLNKIMEKGEGQSCEQSFQVDDVVESGCNDHRQQGMSGRPQNAALLPLDLEYNVPEGTTRVIDQGPATSITGAITPGDANSKVAPLGVSNTSEVEPDEGFPIPVISNQSSWEETPFTDNPFLSDAVDSTTGSWEAFAPQRVEPSSERALTLEISPRRLQSDSDNSQGMSLSNHEVENDVKKWLGGGLAVLGAVIGTVALHNVQRGEITDEPQGRSQPIGRVVELSSELDEDGWVSVDNN